MFGMLNVIKPSQSQTLQASRPVISALIVWGLIRAPLILLLVYLFRGSISTLPVFDGAAIVLRVIDIVSLPVSRILVCLGVAGALGVTVAIALRLRPMPGYFLMVGGTAVVSVALFGLTGTPLRHALIPIVLAATNFLPEALLQRRTDNRIMAIAAGVTEALILRRHLTWLAGLAGLQETAMRWVRLAGWALAVLLVGVCMALLIKGGKLIALEQSIRMPDTASIVILDDINGLAVDAANRRLFATGHGLDTVHDFDLDNPDSPPRVSEVDTGGAQGLAFTADNHEISLFKLEDRQLLFIDAGTLTLNRSVDASNLASGDPWIAVDPISGTIALVSEADFDDGVAFLLLDRASGETLDTREIDAGNLLKHPTKPWLYMSFFRRNPEVQIYDMARREIIVRMPAPARVDRMVLVEASNELLVTSPVTSEILRLDADTLETKGRLKGPFGVRTLAYDADRELLFAGSFVTGQILTIDMQTSRPMGTTYLGPWLRSIELDAENAAAYVSSNGALYRWTYDHFR